MQCYTVYFIWKLLDMFRVEPSPIIRSTNNCIYTSWYLPHRYCYLPLPWKSWNWFECALGGVRHPKHTDFKSFLIIKATRRTNFSIAFLEWNCTCFGQFLCPPSGVFHCTHSNGVCHTGLLTACEQDQDGTAVPSWSCCVYSEKFLMMDRGTVLNM